MTELSGDAEPRGADAAFWCGDGIVCRAGEILLPLCLATVAMPEGEISGFMNLVHDTHHFLSSKGIFNHMELLPRISTENYY